MTLPADLMTDGTDVTVELWFKAASSTASGVLFSYQADALTKSTGNADHHDPALYVGSNGELYGEFWNGSIDPLHSTASVDDGGWHDAVLTGNSTTQSMYLDGPLVGTLSGQIDHLSMTQRHPRRRILAGRLAQRVHHRGADLECHPGRVFRR